MMSLSLLFCLPPAVLSFLSFILSLCSRFLSGFFFFFGLFFLLHWILVTACRIFHLCYSMWTLSSHMGSSSLTRDWAGASGPPILGMWSLCHSLDHQGSPSFQVWFWVTACLDGPSILQGNLVPGHPPNHSSRLLPSYHITGDGCLDTAVSVKGICLFLIPAFVFTVYPAVCYRVTESE